MSITVTPHQNIYNTIFRDLGAKKFYFTTFGELATKYGSQYFPVNWNYLINSHPDSEFCIQYREENDCSPPFEAFIQGNFDDSALWMFTENWNLRYIPDDLKTVKQMRELLDRDGLCSNFVSDEEIQMLIDFVQTDPKPCWSLLNLV